METFVHRTIKEELRSKVVRHPLCLMTSTTPTVLSIPCLASHLLCARDSLAAGSQAASEVGARSPKYVTRIYLGKVCLRDVQSLFFTGNPTMAHFYT